MKRACWDEEGGAAEKRIAVSTPLRCTAASSAAASSQSLSVADFEGHVQRCQLQHFTFDYYMHGLVEETGEVFDAVRAQRAGSSQPEGSERKSTGSTVELELGDVLWYATSLSMEVGGDMKMPATWPLADVCKTGDEPEVLMLATAARLSGRVKKSLRGDKPLEEFVPAMRQHRDELLARCAEVAENHGSTLQRCAMLNVWKFKGRFDRGSVQGDGDAR
ncbi:unnamed protein product [Polarella glacialis]|uniref:NTP pyrophosphohydrolase MazG-like domain-containing protein n=1 Tax=Polarella glacialis TaxID=89957 RepID=A0A813L3A8_POLGL|nr:unnamed protein product [Polarella glacialis]|mmetsp:Transcript_28794/g.51418  ORF Transcript_28794/g.51418 Transcript_28794/m.51418 type:complete len:219 (+) Transcript_28794:57-713(+)